METRMSICDIFSTHLRDMHSYAGWLIQIQDGSANMVKLPTADKYHPDEMSECFEDLVRKAHTILSLPMKEEYFVMPEDNLKQGDGFVYSDNDDWTPMLKGEWEYLGGVKKGTDGKMKHTFSRKDKYCVVAFIEGEALQDFATHCKKAGIELELNEEFKIQ